MSISISISISVHVFETLVASFCVLAVVFAPLERAFPARPEQRVFRPRFVVDLCFFAGQYLLFAGLTAWLLHGVAGWVNAHAHAIAHARMWARSLPLWLHGLLCIGP